MPVVIAAIGDTPYNIILIVHVLLAMVAFAPAFIYPFVANQLTTVPAEQRSSVWGFLMGNSRRIHAPALILTGLLGFALAGLSDGVYAMSQTWLVLSFLIWIVMNGILHAGLVPAERALASGDDSAKRRIDLLGPIMAILLIVMLYLMVFKPGT